MSDNNLVLLSNTHEVLVKHYMIKLTPDFFQETIKGEVILFLENVSSTTSTHLFQLILESCAIDVLKVEEICSSSKWNPNPHSFEEWEAPQRAPLNFSVEEWCIKITKDSIFSATSFPSIIVITYSTTSEGESILWRLDQDGNRCFFSCASQINNRSLLPSQDRPGAEATWELQVEVPSNYYVSCTGDNLPLKTLNKNSALIYYSTDILLPISTFALAAGMWEEHTIPDKLLYHGLEEMIDVSCRHSQYNCHWSSNSTNSKMPLTIVSPSSYAGKVLDILASIPHYLKSCYELLGKFPIKRLQFVLMPRSFSSLAFTSPHLILISQNLLIKDSSTYITISHEICHSWFGVSVGPKNWEEEWISEGFSAFLEDRIYSSTADCLANTDDSDLKSSLGFLDFVSMEDFRKLIISTNTLNELMELRSQIKYKLLTDEMEHTPEDLQVIGLLDGRESNQVSNGLNADKKFLQVSYLKGYFLLTYISNIVGSKAFGEFLKMFVIKYHSTLVSSSDILDEIFEAFPDLLKAVSRSSLENEWLSSPGLNDEMKKMNALKKSNQLLQDVDEHLAFWKSHQTREKNHLPKLLFSDQICHLFDELLQLQELASLQNIHSFYGVEVRCPDIKHRWCEMVIKFRGRNYMDIGQFLINYQSMGIYLYGEMMISEDGRLHKLAKDIFIYVAHELDRPNRKVVAEMLDMTDILS